MNEHQLEQLIQDKGKTAPRVTPGAVESNIASVHYFTAQSGVAGAAGLNPAQIPQPLELLTFCVIVLQNGFTVTGESACASPENFDEEVGRTAAYRNARNKIWPLMGYHLKQKLHDAQQ